MTQKHTPELLPCPFCGGEAHMQSSRHGEWWYFNVNCCTEDCRGNTIKDCNYFEEKLAIDAWNTRTDTAERDRLRGDVRELVGVLGDLIPHIGSGYSGRDKYSLLAPAKATPAKHTGGQK